MELLTNVIRNVRDQMYALELKTDILNDELQSKNMAIALREKMLMRNESGVISPSLTRNVCEIIITLLSSNQILNRPSHTLYKEFNSEIPWAGGNPSGDGGNEMMREGADKFCPDPNRIVEMAVAERVADLVQIVIDELEIEDDPVDETWFYLMRVLLELCDTNHVETHAKLVEQFEKCDMKKLFSLVWKQPRYSIFHGMLQRMVSFILYSNTDPLSPAVAYWFETLNLPEIIRFGIEPRCVLKKIDLFSLRTHHIHLALAVEQAMKNSPSSQGVRSAAEKCPTWPIITALVDEWLNDAMDEFERAVAPQRHALYEFKSQTVSVQMTDVFDTTLGDLQVSSETKGFNVQGMRFGKIDINLEENDVDESKFEAACGMKKCSLLDSWPMHDGDRSSPFPAFADEWPGEKKSNGSAVDDWPGADSERKTEGSAVFGASSWEDVPASSSSESWASFPLSASTPRKAADDDEWADFSSLKTGNSSVENAGDWPGLEKEEDTNWPETNAAETSNPVLAGLAKGVINSSLGEHGIVDQSEC
ncbi:unnamed protein product [Nippostrongylus brasiliensis]|uniref:Rab-GAP TBC domain-containing protein n=1 Tax=Nippostrongylus brasiliensis TaxID=27835 RepID=A0A0N4Y5X4_NIPBR|nr:unnamed protein product [Nippostrongylus brasiliensis]